MGDRMIRGVADTALWTAGLRAIETGRRDAAVVDPYADLLAGEQGRRIARALTPSAAVGWGVVVRTSAIDRLVEEAVNTGVDTVINLGAGMDTRPYRMTLPPEIRWVELDLPEIIEVKNARLHEHRPACGMDRIAIDLLVSRDRRRVFAELAGQCRRALVITEGMIPYFSNEDAASLAQDIFDTAAFGDWILDFDNAGVRTTPRSWKKSLEAAPFRFAVADWFHFFDDLGWRTGRVVTSADESMRIQRPFPLSGGRGFFLRALPRAVSQRILSASGAVALVRKTGSSDSLR